MRAHTQSAALTVMWVLALAAALTSVRYFFVPPRWLLANEILALSRNHIWILVHIACGIAAIAVGPLQFVGRLRQAYPRVHRAMGYAYLSAVLLAGCVALELSADTPTFAADGLAELTTFDLSFVGLSPSFLGYGISSSFSAKQFLLVRAGFTALAIVWLMTGAVALLRARQRRFHAHRAWMMRNYSLTFAAATVRLAALPFLILTRDPVVAITCTFWSWVLNLALAEWLMRRQNHAGGP